MKLTKYNFSKTLRQSEDFLRNNDVGTYLIRKSDSRDGYSLSFKAENRCRHYMIDSLPNGKFIIIGEPRVHNTLKDLIEYHRKVKIKYIYLKNKKLKLITKSINYHFGMDILCRHLLKIIKNLKNLIKKRNVYLLTVNIIF